MPEATHLWRCSHIPVVPLEACMRHLAPKLHRMFHHAATLGKDQTSITQGKHTCMQHYCWPGLFWVIAQQHNTCCVCRHI